MSAHREDYEALGAKPGPVHSTECSYFYNLFLQAQGANGMEAKRVPSMFLKIGLVGRKDSVNRGAFYSLVDCLAST